MAIRWRSAGGSIALTSAFLLSLIRCSFSMQHIVGDAAGWTLPSFGHVNYTDWASNRSFRVGDSLLFNYRPDIHNLLLVTRSDYRSCSSPNPVGTFDDGKTSISLTSAGSKYYICGVAGHCAQGQKLSIMVLGSESEPPALSPSAGGLIGSPPPRQFSSSPIKAPAAGPSTSGTSLRSVLVPLIIGIAGAINSFLSL